MNRRARALANVISYLAFDQLALVKEAEQHLIFCQRSPVDDKGEREGHRIIKGKSFVAYG